MERLAGDLATIQVRDAIRAEARALLRQAGLVLQPASPPPPIRPRRSPSLRLVSSMPDGEAATNTEESHREAEGATSPSEAADAPRDDLPDRT
jgi:hypothetical protein